MKFKAYHGVRPVVVRLDVLEIARVFERGEVPVELAHPEVDRRIAVTNRAEVALEMADIDRVEPNLL